MRASARDILERHAAERSAEVSPSTLPALDPATWRRRECACGSCDVCRHWRAMAADHNARAWRENGPKPAPRPEPFASVAHAVCAMYAAKIDGAPIPGTGDPDRLESRLAGLAASRSHANAGPGVRMVEDLHAVRAAFQAAWRPMPECRFLVGPEDAQAMALFRWVVGMTFAECETAMENHVGYRVPAKLIARLVRHGHERIYQYLRERGMVAEERPRGRDGDDMAGFEDRDLRGWKEIAAYLRCSETSAQRYADRGMPVYVFGRMVEACSRELAQWRDAQTTPPKVA